MSIACKELHWPSPSSSSTFVSTYVEWARQRLCASQSKAGDQGVKIVLLLLSLVLPPAL